MKSLLNLFRPSPEEQAIEAELSGSKLKYSPRSNPPKRGGTSTPGTTPTEASADSELMQLRSSLATVESRLQAVTSERDSLKAEFSQYRSATQADQRSLEKENSHLKKALDETGRMLSAQIASAGQSGPIPEATGAEPEARGLARSIQAAKAEACRTNPQKPLQRPVI